MFPCIDMGYNVVLLLLLTYALFILIKKKKNLCKDCFLHFLMFGSTKKNGLMKNYLWFTENSIKNKTFFRGHFLLKFFRKQLYLIAI